MLTKHQVLKRVANLNVARSGDKRWPHKPLLLLLAIKQFLSGKEIMTFDEIELVLIPLLKTFAPPAKSPNVKDPYWRFMTDELWSVTGTDHLHTTPPNISVLRKTKGSLSDELKQYLETDEEFLDQVVTTILESYFPDSLHEDLITTVGLEWEPRNIRESASGFRASKKKRNPDFRNEVLRAYDFRCALTGFQASLGGAYFGCEAAHVRWHAFEGPDTIDNGISLEPTMHKLFDIGAWSLTDDRRVIVSADFSGSDYAIEKLRSHHGRSISPPVPGTPQLSLEHIRWHRDRDKGGIFREPALRL